MDTINEHEPPQDVTVIEHPVFPPPLTTNSPQPSPLADNTDAPQGEFWNALNTTPQQPPSATQPRLSYDSAPIDAPNFNLGTYPSLERGVALSTAASSHYTSEHQVFSSETSVQPPTSIPQSASLPTGPLPTASLSVTRSSGESRGQYTGIVPQVALPTLSPFVADTASQGVSFSTVLELSSPLGLAPLPAYAPFALLTLFTVPLCPVVLFVSAEGALVVVDEAGVLAVLHEARLLTLLSTSSHLVPPHTVPLTWTLNNRVYAPCPFPVHPRFRALAHVFAAHRTLAHTDLSAQLHSASSRLARKLPSLPRVVRPVAVRVPQYPEPAALAAVLAGGALLAGEDPALLVCGEACSGELVRMQLQVLLHGARARHSHSGLALPTGSQPHSPGAPQSPPGHSPAHGEQSSTPSTPSHASRTPSHASPYPHLSAHHIHRSPSGSATASASGSLFGGSFFVASGHNSPFATQSNSVSAGGRASLPLSLQGAPLASHFSLPHSTPDHGALTRSPSLPLTGALAHSAAALHALMQPPRMQTRVSSDAALPADTSAPTTPLRPAAVQSTSLLADTPTVHIQGHDQPRGQPHGYGYEYATGPKPHAPLAFGSPEQLRAPYIGYPQAHAHALTLPADAQYGSPQQYQFGYGYGYAPERAPGYAYGYEYSGPPSLPHAHSLVQPAGYPSLTPSPPYSLAPSPQFPAHTHTHATAAQPQPVHGVPPSTTATAAPSLSVSQPQGTVAAALMPAAAFASPSASAPGALPELQSVHAMSRPLAERVASSDARQADPAHPFALDLALSRILEDGPSAAPRTHDSAAPAPPPLGTAPELVPSAHVPGASVVAVPPAAARQTSVPILLKQPTVPLPALPTVAALTPLQPVTASSHAETTTDAPALQRQGSVPSAPPALRMLSLASSRHSQTRGDPVESLLTRGPDQSITLRQPTLPRLDRTGTLAGQRSSPTGPVPAAHTHPHAALSEGVPATLDITSPADVGIAPAASTAPFTNPLSPTAQLHADVASPSQRGCSPPPITRSMPDPRATVPFSPLPVSLLLSTSPLPDADVHPSPNSAPAVVAAVAVAEVPTPPPGSTLAAPMLTFGSEGTFSPPHVSRQGTGTIHIERASGTYHSIPFTLELPPDALGSLEEETPQQPQLHTMHTDAGKPGTVEVRRHQRTQSHGNTHAPVLFHSMQRADSADLTAHRHPPVFGKNSAASFGITVSTSPDNTPRCESPRPLARQSTLSLPSVGRSCSPPRPSVQAPHPRPPRAQHLSPLAPQSPAEQASSPKRAFAVPRLPSLTLPVEPPGSPGSPSGVLRSMRSLPRTPQTNRSHELIPPSPSGGMPMSPMLSPRTSMSMPLTRAELATYMQQHYSVELKFPNPGDPLNKQDKRLLIDFALGRDDVEDDEVDGLFMSLFELPRAPSTLSNPYARASSGNGEEDAWWSPPPGELAREMNTEEILAAVRRRMLEAGGEEASGDAAVDADADADPEMTADGAADVSEEPGFTNNEGPESSPVPDVTIVKAVVEAQPVRQRSRSRSGTRAPAAESLAIHVTHPGDATPPPPHVNHPVQPNITAEISKSESIHASSVRGERPMDMLRVPGTLGRESEEPLEWRSGLDVGDDDWVSQCPSPPLSMMEAELGEEEELVLTSVRAGKVRDTVVDVEAIPDIEIAPRKGHAKGDEKKKTTKKKAKKEIVEAERGFCGCFGSRSRR